MIICTKETGIKPVELPMRGVLGNHTYTVTSDYILKDGMPYIYRMGEIHFSRVPETDWEHELVKMKNGGIDIVASYVFWNHHEHDEGRFDFSGNKNIRRFVDICMGLDMPFFLRIGPWAHGEARNGGFPDWLVEKNCALRTVDKKYMSYVRRFFEEIYNQLKGCDNIIGIQVENEKSNDPEYLEGIRKILLEIGYRAPLWSATGWGRAQLPDTLLPMFGGYPEAPWEEHVRKLAPNTNYFFSKIREDSVIGADILGRSSGRVIEEKYLGRFPYLTCELGGGNQPTFHRRPLFSDADIAALAICKLGSGANGLGYYMYHGGVNPVSRDERGRLITYQESRESGYANDYAIVSYDFKAPLGDTGQIRDSFFALREINRFVSAVGEQLAPMRSFLPERGIDDLNDTESARIAVRSDGIGGFVFYNNHVHGKTLAEKHEELEIVLCDGKLELPVLLPESEYGIIPFNFKIGNERVRWVTALPVSYSEKSVEFVPLRKVKPEICLADGKILPLDKLNELGGARIVLSENEHIKPDRLLPLTVEKKPNVLSFEAFEHIIRMDGTHLSDRTSEYEIKLPVGTEKLCVKTIGNVAAAYDMGSEPRLVSDYYCDGDDWYIDVRGVGTLRIKLQPLLDGDRENIYFETDMPENITEVKAFAV